MAIFNLIKLKCFRAYPSLKPHILFSSNGLAIWHGFPDITHLKNIAADSRRDLLISKRVPIFELIRALGEMDIWYQLWSDA